MPLSSSSAHRHRRGENAPRSPPPARRVSLLESSQSEPLGLLNRVEREYVSGLKRKERGELTDLLARPARAVTATAPLRVRVLQSSLPEETKLRIFGELGRGASDKYMAWVLKLLRIPRTVVLGSSLRREGGLEEARARMDARIVGQEAAKREVLKVVQQARRNPRDAPTAYALAFEGPPGSGKTQFVRGAMAAALDRPVVSIPLGGGNEGASFLWGHNYTYEGSKEGRLVGGLIEAACCNPIVHFDELDKVVETERGGAEVIASLIHLIDPSTNRALRDRYFHDVDIDFSRCVFVFSYNDASRINPILLNRLKRIRFAAPTDGERRRILRDVLLPRAQERLRTTLDLSGDAIDLLLSAGEQKGEAGMRDLERRLDHVLSDALLDRECSADRAPGDETDGVLTAERVATLLSHWETQEGGDAPPPHMYL